MLTVSCPDYICSWRNVIEVLLLQSSTTTCYKTHSPENIIWCLIVPGSIFFNPFFLLIFPRVLWSNSHVATIEFQFHQQIALYNEIKLNSSYTSDDFFARCLSKFLGIARYSKHAFLLVAKLQRRHVEEANEVRVFEGLDANQEPLHLGRLPCSDEHWNVALWQLLMLRRNGLDMAAAAAVVLLGHCVGCSGLSYDPRCEGLNQI